jgi:hypothetical protein
MVHPVESASVLQGNHGGNGMIRFLVVLFIVFFGAWWLAEQVIWLIETCRDIAAGG